MAKENKLNLTAPVCSYFEFVSINDNVLFVKKSIINELKLNSARPSFNGCY